MGKLVRAADRPTSLPIRTEYNCVPGFGGSWCPAPDGGEPLCVAQDGQGTKQTPVSCAQFSQCNGQLCTCDSCGCAASVENGRSFDVTFDADLVTGVGDGHNVRLMRDVN